MAHRLARVLALVLLGVSLAATTAAPAAAQDDDRERGRCSWSHGVTKCFSRSSTTEWVYVAYESGDSNDGSLTGQWCQQEEPGSPVNFYETFATYFEVETTTWTRTVRRGWSGKVLSRTTWTSRQILSYEMPRDPDQEPAPGDTLSCSYAAS